MVFIVAAMLYHQSRSPTPESFVGWGPALPGAGAQVPGFQNAWATWTPTKPPVAGRLYDPMNQTNNTYPVPTDLSKAPVSQPFGSIPLSQQRPNQTPGTGTTTAPREALAQIKDLRELDNKITLWLEAVSQREREQPGSLTPLQLQRRVMLQARLQDVRDQMGTGMIIDTWKQVADELKELRVENAGWQQMSPSMEDAYAFGQDSKTGPDGFLTHEDFVKFYALFNAGVLELNGLTQANPLQKVRLQQLQVMRQDLMDNAKRMGTPPIKMGSAQLYLRRMLRVDQPLPTLYSLEPPPMDPRLSLESNPIDVITDLRNIQWKLTVVHDPVAQEMKRATAALLDRIQSGQMSAQEARSQVAGFQNMMAPGAIGSSYNPYNPKNMVARAKTLCKRIGEAFPDDVEALGCGRKVTDDFEAETVINTVCERLRFSVPTVTPEQFNCPVKTNAP